MLHSIRNTFAAFTAATPYVKGLGRLYAGANTLFLKLGAEPITWVRMHDGARLKVDLRSLTEFHAFYLKEYDPHLIALCKRLYHTDQLFLDVGANIGFYSIAIAAHIKTQKGSGKVLCFEPHPNNLRRLAENSAANNLDSLVVQFPIALSDHRGEALLELREDFEQLSETGNASIASTLELKNSFRKLKVQTAKLDEILRDSSLAEEKISFIKVDIEGHEDFFLRGATHTLQTQRPILLLEVNKPFYRQRGVSPNEVLLAALPENYLVFLPRKGKLEKIANFDVCKELDNVLLLPAEKSP